MSCIGHVIGNGKYEWLILNNVARKADIGVGSVYWENFDGSFFGIRYLYLRYNYIILVSNDWIGSFSPYGLFYTC